MYLDFLFSHRDFVERILNAKHSEIILAEEWRELVEQLDSVPGVQLELPRFGVRDYRNGAIHST